MLQGHVLLVATLALGSLTACASRAPAVSNVSETPAPIAEHECEACGMIVREQPAPRGQVLHQDGTRRYFCSMMDLAVYVETPSAHGRVVRTWVERLTPASDPAVAETGDLPWIAAEGASYVLGVARRGVMGTPVLAYGNESDASSAVSRFGGTVVTWGAMRAALTTGETR